MNHFILAGADHSCDSRLGSSRRTDLLAYLLAAILLMEASARATFHLWKVTEIYSSADGSVQFVELTNSSSFNVENVLSGHSIICSNQFESHTYTFPTNLPATTANKTLLIGTANLVFTPGGLRPDYVLTNAVPFLLPNSGTVNYADADLVTYTNLPTDGVGSLIRSNGASGPMIFTAKNFLKNYSGATNSIVPVRISTAEVNGGNFVLTFATASGPNGTAGSNYAIQAVSAVTSTIWTTVTNLTGNGTLKTVAIPIEPATNNFFRLRVP